MYYIPGDQPIQRGRSQLKQDQAELAQRTADYLRNGGIIDVLPFGVTRHNPLTGRHHTSDTRTQDECDGLLNIDKASTALGITPARFRHGLKRGQLNGCPMPPMADTLRRLYDPETIDAWLAKHGQPSKNKTAQVEQPA